MKTFLQFLNESTNPAIDTITSNPSKKFSEIIPLLADVVFESWFNTNGVKVISK